MTNDFLKKSKIKGTRRKFTPFTRSRHWRSAELARRILHLASGTMTIPLNVTGQNRESHQLLPLSGTYRRWLCGYSRGVARFELRGKSL